MRKDRNFKASNISVPLYGSLFYDRDNLQKNAKINSVGLKPWVTLQRTKPWICILILFGDTNDMHLPVT